MFETVFAAIDSPVGFVVFLLSLWGLGVSLYHLFVKPEQEKTLHNSNFCEWSKKATK